MQDKRLSLGRLEAAVLDALWRRGESTVAEVLDALPAGRERHYNTCSTVLTRLVKRRLVGRRARGRAHLYRALVTREELGRAYLDSVRRDVFGGSLRGLVSALLDPRDARGADADALRALIDEIEADERKARRGR